ncbi:GNAT family N-acetyltransferase [Desulfopila sp. IMCC35008]|uniref:GNAT family N-acetyltransferase n=1 Tax=Desulfopila sp. IMCC35008 TaxID=2653858 RepID=UPI0013D4B140|nr:GNAT family N-acetyltransferase [Desulfopila sp. IMCC35008]
MDYTVEPLVGEDVQKAVEIFNYYIENSFAAYREEKITADHYRAIIESAEGYPKVSVRDQEGTYVGFGLLVPHKPIPVFSHSANLICFLLPQATGKGLGKMVLDYLEREGVKRGIQIILSSISSRNPESLRFHLKNGFTECGRFQDVGKKNGKFFDIVWMDKHLDSSSLHAVERFVG